ncbi:MAG: hyi [Verrucomicrobiaceae bacterium]|nr:hyi [Verrucomicrobiaceae bacterium]
MNRRSFFRSSAAASAASLGVAAASSASAMTIEKSAADPAYKIMNHHLKQTIMGWCFKPMDTLTLAKHCADIGLVGMEGIDKAAYKDVMALGLKISLVGSHSFNNGPCNPAFRDEVVKKLTDGINLAADVGCKKVITFTGMKFDGMDRTQAIKGCLDTWKQVLPLAEQKGITLCLEHLNSRDGSKPMTGHPGYFGDDVDFCFDLVKQMGSPNFKLLFDIYHVQIMNGDVIRRLRTNHELIGHYHTAGNPGRCELDENQEINYPAIVKAIIDTGYADFIAQEFMPTWQDPILALRHAAMVCDVA